MRALLLPMLSLLAIGCSSGSDRAASMNASPDGHAPSLPDGFDVHVPETGRALEILRGAALAEVIAAMPRVAAEDLRALLESTDTLWYDRTTIVPGYQDSFGDNVITPIGMRPNSIDASLIDTAVPGGSAQIFARQGLFHFPFGRGPEVVDTTRVVNFWSVPRDTGGKLLPVVWWRRDPNGYTHRFEWAFPAGTIFGEVLFLDGAEGLVAFEIRTRRRELSKWSVDVYRPFPRAEDLALAIEAVRPERDAWLAAGELDAFLTHLRDPGTLEPATLAATHFASAFPAIHGARDTLPALADPSILAELLRRVPFRSARGVAWKEGDGLVTWAPTAEEEGSIVPPAYDAGFLRIDDDACRRCHENAGRPFKDYYPNILAYGEIWGEDESFTWHPFRTSSFVDADGDVVNFNYDNRVMRPDLLEAGLLEKYAAQSHPSSIYTRLPGAWKNYAY